MTNCWIEDPDGRPTFTAIVQKIDPFLASIAGYNELTSEESTDFMNTDLMTPESEGANAESSPNIEAVNDAPVTSDAVELSSNEETACNKLSLPGDIEDHFTTEISAKIEISVSDEDLFQNGVPAKDEDAAADESVLTKKYYASDETSITREVEVNDDIDCETCV